MSKKLKVAFIGTGIMGAPIAGHIMDAGYPLTVFNRTKAKAEGLIAKGATWADSPAEAAKDADVVFTMVGFPTDVEEIYLAGDGVRIGGADAAAFCRALPERAGVVAIPLTAFVAADHHAHYAGLVRFAACKRVEVLEEAARRLQTFG